MSKERLITELMLLHDVLARGDLSEISQRIRSAQIRNEVINADEHYMTEVRIRESGNKDNIFYADCKLLIH
ncbi:MAG: hypothetical protein WC346_06600 [Methanogenium sp.]